MRPPPVEMTASGPFAMGPSGASASSSRGAPRAPIAPIAPRVPGANAPEANLTQSAAPTLKKEPRPRSVLDRQLEEDVEIYSDQEGDVEVIDIQGVRNLDYMAPEPVRKEKEKQKRKVKREPSVKSEKDESMQINEDLPSNDAREVDAANAIDLSESEDEEEMEDLIDDFTFHSLDETDIADSQQERIYLFQFPEPFPHFTSPDTHPVDSKGKSPEKRVSFTQDTKPGSSVPPGVDVETEKKPETQEPEPLDGIIGQLEVHRSGAVKMRLANGILMDVTAATQPSFLQQAVHVDSTNTQMHVLGEISRRFVVTPDVDALLDAMARVDALPVRSELDSADLISMDTT